MFTASGEVFLYFLKVIHMVFFIISFDITISLLIIQIFFETSFKTELNFNGWTHFCDILGFFNSLLKFVILNTFCKFSGLATSIVKKFSFLKFSDGMVGQLDWPPIESLCMICFRLTRINNKILYIFIFLEGKDKEKTPFKTKPKRLSLSV